jgi:hypothetical protein
MNLNPLPTQLIVVRSVVRVNRFSLNPKGGHPINHAESFLEDARKSFCLAAKATGLKETERYAAMGRDYLQLAHHAAKIDDDTPAPGQQETALNKLAPGQ